MSRIRTVKPELFNHEALFEAEQAYQLPLRLAFIALFTCCDKAGRFRWQPRRLKLDMLPYDDLDMARVFDALNARGFIKKYECDGESYGCIPSWSRHQVLNHRETDSPLPPEPDACPTREGRESDIVRACPGGIGKGKGNKEMEGEEEGNGSIVASETRPSSALSSIQHVFEYWKGVMQHQQANLDVKRSQLIQSALKGGYSVDSLCEAIKGCSLTPHNQGHNDRGQRYDGLHIILRDSDQIDRFIHNAKHPPRILNKADLRLQSNIRNLQSVLDKSQGLGAYENH